MSSLKSSAPPSSIALVSEGGMGFEFWIGVGGHIAPMTSTSKTDNQLLRFCRRYTPIEKALARALPKDLVFRDVA